VAQVLCGQIVKELRVFSKNYPLGIYWAFYQFAQRSISQFALAIAQWVNWWANCKIAFQLPSEHYLGKLVGSFTKNSQIAHWAIGG